MYLFILQSIFFYLIVFTSKIGIKLKVSLNQIKLLLVIQFIFGVFNIITPDSIGYKESIKFLKQGRDGHLEWIYKEILFKFNYNYYILMSFIFILMFLCLYLIFKEHKKNYQVIMYIFTILFLGDFYNIARSSLASVIFFLGFLYIDRKKIKFGILLMLFSTIFHKSSIILLIIFIFSKIKWNMKRFVLTISFIPIFTGYFNQNYMLILKFLNLSKYTWYFKNHLNLNLNIIVRSIPTTGVLYLLTIYCISYYLNNDFIYKGGYKKLVNMVIILFLISTLMLFLNVSYYAFQRIFLLTSLPLVFLLSKIYIKNQKKLDYIFLFFLLGQTLGLITQCYRYFVRYGI